MFQTSQVAITRHGVFVFAYCALCDNEIDNSCNVCNRQLLPDTTRRFISPPRCATSSLNIVCESIANICLLHASVKFLRRGKLQLLLQAEYLLDFRLKCGYINSWVWYSIL